MYNEVQSVKVIDLCSGLGGFSEAFIDRGHEVIRIDNDPKFKEVPNTIIMDIRETGGIVYICKNPDVILAGPNCRCFSMGSLHHHWEMINGYRLPRSQTAIDDLGTVYTILHIIQLLKPKFWIIENPKATLHKFIGEPQGSLTYCQYGERRRKETYFFGVIPESFEFKKCKKGSDCHVSGPRGSYTGTEGMSKSERKAQTPYELSKALCIAIEKQIGGVHTLP